VPAGGVAATDVTAAGAPADASPHWLAMASLILLAAGLVLGGLRLAGKRALSR
jgi:hypothetical protein